MLSFDTTNNFCSVALIDYDKCVNYCCNNQHSRQAEMLFPMIHDLIGETYDGITALSVMSGPGSFTGIRIGISAALGIGMCKDIPLYSATTLEVSAYCVHLLNPLKTISVILPAVHGKFYFQEFDCEIRQLSMPLLKSIEEIEYNCDIVCGFELDKIIENIPNNIKYCKVIPNAKSLGLYIDFLLESKQNPKEAEPFYLRELDIRNKMR